MNDTDDTSVPQEEETNAQEECPNELELANKKIEELNDQAMRAMADLQNYKKRAEEEKQAFVKFASASVFSEILPVFDSFERAAEHLPEDLVENDWVKGIQNIIKQFEQIMEKFKITKMKAVGEKFNTDFHEAIAQGPGEKDVVIEELESGYLIEDQTLRPAKVKVGDGS
ncbi:nucleotide exchange factor GrpE [Patescibacteria group bacterium]